jgi:hypothetical protein
MSSVGYPGPKNVARAVAELFPDRKDIRILDMAAGNRATVPVCEIISCVCGGVWVCGYYGGILHHRERGF